MDSPPEYAPLMTSVEQGDIDAAVHRPNISWRLVTPLSTYSRRRSYPALRMSATGLIGLNSSSLT